jgi:hypothetical protein
MTSEIHQRDELEENARRTRAKLINEQSRQIVEEHVNSVRPKVSALDRWEREQERQAGLDRENERVYDWLQRRNFEDAAQHSEPVAAGTVASGWEAWDQWFNAKFSSRVEPVLEAIGEELAERLDAERQRRDELAAELKRLKAKNRRLFSSVSELRRKIESLTESAGKRNDPASAQHNVHHLNVEAARASR